MPMLLIPARPRPTVRSPKPHTCTYSRLPPLCRPRFQQPSQFGKQGGNSHPTIGAARFQRASLVLQQRQISAVDQPVPDGRNRLVFLFDHVRSRTDHHLLH